MVRNISSQQDINCIEKAVDIRDKLNFKITVVLRIYIVDSLASSDVSTRSSLASSDISIRYSLVSSDISTRSSLASSDISTRYSLASSELCITKQWN